jgi:hypothetical protein
VGGGGWSLVCAYITSGSAARPILKSALTFVNGTAPAASSEAECRRARKIGEMIGALGDCPEKTECETSSPMTAKSAPRRLLRDTRGTTLVLVALMITALIGFTGLGVETGLWYAIKRQNQSAADVAALSGAFELLAGQGSGLTATQVYPNICGFAQRDATRNGFTFASFTCPTSTSACTSP